MLLLAAEFPILTLVRYEYLNPNLITILSNCSAIISSILVLFYTHI